MKIKRERQVRFDELLKHVWDGDVANAKFIGSGKYDIYVDSAGDIDVDAISYIVETDLFTITEEVEITEDTILESALVIDCCNDVYQELNYSITNIKGDYTNIKFIYLQNSDGSIGQLIWSKERGLVD